MLIIMQNNGENYLLERLTETKYEGHLEIS